MPQIHGNWALCEMFLQFCMMLHMGIRYSKQPQTKWVGPLVAGLHNIKNGRIIYTACLKLFLCKTYFPNPMFPVVTVLVYMNIFSK